MKSVEFITEKAPAQTGFWSGLRAGLTGQISQPPAAQPPAAQPPVAQSTNAFTSPELLLKTFNEYINAGGKYTPRLRGAVKDIWMQMGGIKAESQDQ